MNKAFSRFVIFSSILCLLIIFRFFQTNQLLKQEVENDSRTIDELQEEIISIKKEISAKQEELVILSENEKVAELSLWENRFEQLKEAAE